MQQKYYFSIFFACFGIGYITRNIQLFEEYSIVRVFDVTFDQCKRIPIYEIEYKLFSHILYIILSTKFWYEILSWNFHADRLLSYLSHVIH